jgi:hypothetical protein
MQEPGRQSTAVLRTPDAIEHRVPAFLHLDNEYGIPVSRFDFGVQDICGIYLNSDEPCGETLC